jgi:hypothetical protein
MKTEKIRELLERYYEGDTTLEEEQLLSEFFAGDEIPEQFKSHAAQFTYFDKVRDVKQSITDEMLFGKIDTSNAGNSTTIFSYQLTRNIFRVAASVAFLIIGFAAGVWYNQHPNNNEISLNETPGNYKVSHVFTHFQKASASEQIKLISQVSQQSNTNVKVLQALIYTLNNDDNVNVRMAAAEALFHFKNEQPARESLIQALKRESDPNMQITLIDMLVKMREKKAVNVMQVLLMKNHLDKIVRNELEQGIGILS